MGGEYTPPSRLLPTFQTMRMARATRAEKWWLGKGSAMVGRGLAQGDGEEGGDEEEPGDDGEAGVEGEA